MRRKAERGQDARVIRANLVVPLLLIQNDRFVVENKIWGESMDLFDRVVIVLWLQLVVNLITWI